MIREFKFRNKTYKVIIDVIKEVHGGDKPSKTWSEWKKRNRDWNKALDVKDFNFKSSNGRVYLLECISAKQENFIRDKFSRSQTTPPPKGKTPSEKIKEILLKCYKDIEAVLK